MLCLSVLRVVVGTPVAKVWFLPWLKKNSCGTYPLSMSVHRFLALWEARSDGCPDKIGTTSTSRCPVQTNFWKAESGGQCHSGQMTISGSDIWRHNLKLEVPGPILRHKAGHGVTVVRASLCALHNALQQCYPVNIVRVNARLVSTWYPHVTSRTIYTFFVAAPSIFNDITLYSWEMSALLAVCNLRAKEMVPLSWLPEPNHSY